MILGCEILPVPGGGALVLTLNVKWGGVPLASPLFLLMGRPRLYAARSAVEAGRRSIVDDDRPVVNVGHICDADIGHGAVVVKRAAAPFAAHKADAAVAESVINPAVKADVRSPVSGMPSVESATPSPISRSPQQTNRGDHPCSRYPVIAVIIVPTPITGRPDVAGAGADRLRVDG